MKKATVEPKYREMARQMRADGVSEEIGEDEFRRGKGVTKIEALRGRRKIPTRKHLTVNTKGRRHGSNQDIGARPARRDRQSGLKRLM